MKLATVSPGSSARNSLTLWRAPAQSPDMASAMASTRWVETWVRFSRSEARAEVMARA